MKNSGELFDDLDVSPGTSPKSVVKWRLVSNQPNLLYMLGAGMIMPPRGFGKKYYEDALSSFPGWIPLFPNVVPKAAIELSVQEKKRLAPCIVTIDLTGIIGPVAVLDANGKLRRGVFPDLLTGDETALLMPAPLPVSRVESIAFRSTEDRANCEADAADVNNVPIKDFKLEIDSRLYSGAGDVPWPPKGVSLQEFNYSMDQALAAGGMMGMLLQMGNRGDVGIQACRLAFDPELPEGGAGMDAMLQGPWVWRQKGVVPHRSNVLPWLFWGAVEKVSACRTGDAAMSAFDAILEHLETAGQNLDERMKSVLAKLAVDLKKLAGLSENTITELLERHPKPFSRVMTLFFLRKKCSELLEFSHPLLTETDYVAAAILFAARDGWLGMPLNIRGSREVQAAVAHRMAVMAHQLSGTGLELGVPPARPMLLRELFAQGGKGWSAKQKEAALLVARENKWDCIETRISLGKGDYRMRIDGTGTHIFLSGEAKDVATEVNAQRFFPKVGESRLSDKLDKKVRSLLNG